MSAIIHINLEKVTNHIMFANRLQIPEFHLKNKLLTNIIKCTRVGNQPQSTGGHRLFYRWYKDDAGPAKIGKSSTEL